MTKQQRRNETDCDKYRWIICCFCCFYPTCWDFVHILLKSTALLKLYFHPILPWESGPPGPPGPPALSPVVKGCKCRLGSAGDESGRTLSSKPCAGG